MAVDDLTRICALLYRSPEFKLKAQEIKDHFKEGAEPIIRKAVEGGMDAGHIKVAKIRFQNAKINTFYIS